MRRFILLAFIGVVLTKNAAPLKSQRYPSRLAWLFGLNNNNVHENKEEPPTVCQSQECEKFAQIMSDNMDKSVDPCDDFYEYACGNWLKHNPIPEGQSSWSMYKKAQENVEQQIKEILDDGIKSNDLLAMKFAKKWYETCMDTDTMDRQGPQPLLFTLFRIGGWPMIMDPDEWNEEEYSWQKVDDQYMRLTGKNTFYDVSVSKYNFNRTGPIHIGTPHLPPGSYLLRIGTSYDSEEEDESDEDLSDEEKHSGEQKDSQEPGSDEKPDNKSDEKGDNKDDDKDNDKVDNTNDDEDDNDDDDDDDNDGDDDTNEENDNENAKKKVVKKKIAKFANRKNKKLEHNRKSGTHSKKHESYMTKKQRVKRRAIPNTNVREKLHARKNERNARKARKERQKKTLEATTPRISTEETIDDDKEIMVRYANYVLKVARVLAKARGIEVSEEHMEKDIQNMIAFQKKLTHLIMESGEDLEMTLNDFQKWYNEKEHENDHSAIDWLYKIGELFDEAHVPIHEDLNLKVNSPDYIEGLISLLDETSSRTIVNYVHWNFLSRIIKTSTSEMRKLYNAWENLDDDDEDDKKDDNKARSSQCIEEVEIFAIVAYEYVRKHYSDEISQTASDMIDDIQKEVEYLIKKSDWMDEDTKDFVLAKLVNMDRFIGYPDWYKNNTVVKRFNQGLIIGNSYYENILSYNRYAMWKELQRLIKEENDEIWSMSPTMVNAFFSPYDNAMSLSAADFQSPWFAYGRPQAINYGIIGSIMGHEVNHGFDNNGHLFDKKGELVEWLSAMAEAYGKRAHCFVEQFNNYPLDKNSNFTIKNYGNQTVSDNIADTMGLQAAYRAYQRRERECGKPNAVLPGHEKLTNDQLFFLSFASLWCGTENKAKLKRDGHSPGRLRLIGSISNSEDFAEVYNCPAGSPMNPEKKCNIWK